MKLITIPAPLAIMHPTTGLPAIDTDTGKPIVWAFSDFIERALLLCKPFERSYKTRRAAMILSAHFGGKGAGDVVPTEDEHHALLVEAISGPLPLAIGVARQTVIFEQAIIDAKDPA